MKFIQNNPSWDSTKIPKEDYKIKEELESLFVQCKGTEKKDWITYDEFEKIVKKISKKDDSGIKSILRRLHALGISLWYEDMKENNMLILNPEWICNGIYSIINWVHDHERYDITFDEFSDVFVSDKERYSIGNYNFLFELMEKYELAYKDEHNEKKLIIPHLLKEDCPSALPEMNAFESLSIRFTSDDVLPDHTISRFIVRKNGDIKKVNEEEMVWRYGVVLENKAGNIGLIEERKNSITVSVRGPDRTDYITMIRDSFIEIFETYRTDKPDVEYKLRLYGDNAATSEIREIWLEDETIREYLKNDRPYYDPKKNRDYPMKEPASEYGITVNVVVNVFIKKYHKQNIELQRGLNDLIHELRENGHQEEAADIEGLIKAVKEDNSLEDENDIKASGFMNKVKRFLKKVNDENSTLNKIVTGIRDGAEIVGEIAKAYNNTAKLLGLS